MPPPRKIPPRRDDREASDPYRHIGGCGGDESLLKRDVRQDERSSAMTPVVAFSLAIIAGCLVPDRRRALAVVTGGWLAVLILQSWYIAAGDAVSPPSTVDHFPELIGYWFVQALALGLALGRTAQLVALRRRRDPSDPRPDASAPTRLAVVLAFIVTAVVVLLYFFAHSLFESGSAAEHTEGGSPPVLGVLCLLLMVIGNVALAVVRRLRRHPAGAPEPNRALTTSARD
jgi:hypothetical protein